MRLALAYFYGNQSDKINVAKQLGVMEAVVNVRGDGRLNAGERAWDYRPLKEKIENFKREGIKVSVIEGPSPLDRAKLGLDGRDEEIEDFLNLLKYAGELGVETICYNWMPVIGWFRTFTDKKTRGGALVTGFDYKDAQGLPNTEYGEVTENTLWANLEYFLRAAVPAAEKAGINLALHPDDPPVGSIRGISRILTSAEAMQKVIDTVKSPVNGITMCQGSFSCMGEDVIEMIEKFGGQHKIFFAHFRDIRGDKFHFEETFHDDGQQDMLEAMKAYKRVGYSGVMRPDHVPTMIGEDNSNPSYAILGNLFAVGYMKGLIEAVGC